MSHLASDERASLCELLDTLGPDEPTLCEGWRTRDLTAHLILREGRLDAMPGIALPFLAGWTARVQNSLAGGDFKRLVNRLRNGPPLWSPIRLSRIDEAANGIEFFVHHEDVRRAQPQWKPRTLDRATEDAFWRRARFLAKSPLRHKQFGVDAVRTDSGERLILRPPAAGQSNGTLVGLPSELLLYLFGRRDQADVEKQGDVEVFDQFSKP